MNLGFKPRQQCENRCTIEKELDIKPTICYNINKRPSGTENEKDNNTDTIISLPLEYNRICRTYANGFE